MTKCMITMFEPKWYYPFCIQSNPIFADTEITPAEWIDCLDFRLGPSLSYSFISPCNFLLILQAQDWELDFLVCSLDLDLELDVE